MSSQTLSKTNIIKNIVINSASYSSSMPLNMSPKHRHNHTHPSIAFPDRRVAMLRQETLRFPSNAPSANTGNGPSYRRMAPSNMQLNNTNHLYAQLSGNEGIGPQGVQPHAMDNMSQAFNGVNLQGVQSAGVVGQNTNGQLASPIYYQLPNGTFIIPNVNSAPQTISQGRNPYGGFYTPQASYMMNSNGNTSITPPGQQNVPELAPRRSSLSSNEENGPHTPFFGSTTQGIYQPNITSDHSPQLWGTHSPVELGQTFYPQPLAKSPDGVYTYLDLDALCCRHPAIPRSVPAIFSGEKGRGTLEKSLQNQTGTTNVYIRGLLPDTTDEMLHSYGERFGDIQSAKSMLDQATGLCKGSVPRAESRFEINVLIVSGLSNTTTRLMERIVFVAFSTGVTKPNGLG